MADITSLRIKSPYGIESIESLSFFVRPNEHAKLILTGTSNDEKGFEPVTGAGEADIVELCDLGADGKESTIFYGLVRDISIARARSVYTIRIEALSGTTMLDEEEKSRSFQDANLTYDELVSDLLGDMQALVHDGYKEALGEPAIQYFETDWEFLMRAASRLNTVIVPDIKTPNLHFGLPKNPGIAAEFSLDRDRDERKDTGSYMKAIAAGDKLHDMDFFTCEVSTKDIRDVGDGVKFGRMPLRITALFAELVDGDLIFTYTIGLEESVYRATKPAPLKGVSLTGTVLETKGDLLKLHLDIDEKQEAEKAHFFPYAPVTGNGMYAMPILGTKTHLVFPDGFEKNAFAEDCIRENGESCENTVDPDIRRFRTEHGKEIMMAPRTLHFKDTKPGTGNKLALEMDDDFGIRIKSHKNLTLNARARVSVSAGNAVSFSAQSNILFSQTKTISSADGRRFVIPESAFSLENDTHVKAGTTKYRGLSRISYPSFPAAPTGLSAAAAAGTASKALAKKEKESGFSLGNLLKAAVGVVVVAAVAVAVAASAGLLAPALPFIGAAVLGAFCALGAAAALDSKNDTYRSAEDYFAAAIKGGLVAMAVRANPALAGVATLAGLTLLLSGCGKTEELPEDETAATEEREEEEKAVPEPNRVEIPGCDWLIGYDAPSQAADNARSVDCLTSDFVGARDAYKPKYEDFMGALPEWYAREEVGGLNGNVFAEKSMDDSDSVYIKKAEGEEDRYWVAVGPRVTDPEYKIGDAIKPEKIYGENGAGIKLDLKLENLGFNPETKKYEPLGTYVYVYAVTGDVKEHTGNGSTVLSKEVNKKIVESDPIEVDGMGYFQTGISTIDGELAKGSGDGSMVEFMMPKREEESAKPKMTALGYYRLVEILVCKEDSPIKEESQ